MCRLIQVSFGPSIKRYSFLHIRFISRFFFFTILIKIFSWHPLIVYLHHIGLLISHPFIQQVFVKCSLTAFLQSFNPNSKYTNCWFLYCWKINCPGEENGNPFQYSCLGNPMGRGAWRATIHGVTKSRTQLSDKSTWDI